MCLKNNARATLFWTWTLATILLPAIVTSYDIPGKPPGDEMFQGKLALSCHACFFNITSYKENILCHLQSPANTSCPLVPVPDCDCISSVISPSPQEHCKHTLTQNLATELRKQSLEYKCTVKLYKDNVDSVQLLFRGLFIYPKSVDGQIGTGCRDNFNLKFSHFPNNQLPGNGTNVTSAWNYAAFADEYIYKGCFCDRDFCNEIDFESAVKKLRSSGCLVIANLPLTAALIAAIYFFRQSWKLAI